MSEIKDLSKTAMRIGRVIDRLPPGHYMLMVDKPELKDNPSNTVFYLLSRIRDLETSEPIAPNISDITDD